SSFDRLCFRCGGLGHSAGSCSNPPFSRPAFANNVPDPLPVTDGSGSRVCRAFNDRGCSKSTLQTCARLHPLIWRSHRTALSVDTSRRVIGLFLLLTPSHHTVSGRPLGLCALPPPNQSLVAFHLSGLRQDYRHGNPLTQICAWKLQFPTSPPPSGI